MNCGSVVILIQIALSVADQSASTWDIKATVKDVTDSQRLISKLLDSYDPRVRPVRDLRTPTNVTIRLNLYQLLDVNEPNQNIVLNMWMHQMWTDEFLGWDPAEYGGIKSIVLPWEQIWIPDTYLYNSLVMNREDIERWINVAVTTDGKVGHIRFMVPAIFTFSCHLNVRYFPFDHQKCTLTFGSWTSNSKDIDYYPESETILQEDFILNEEWIVESFHMRREEAYFSCCPEYPWILLHAELSLHRKPLFYIINLIIPTAIITLVSIFGFFTPSTSTGERTEDISLGITTLLAMAILLLMVVDSIPTTSDFVPLIGWFLLLIIIMVAAGSVLSSWVICVQRRGLEGDPLPDWARKILAGKLPKIIGPRVPKKLAAGWKKTQKNEVMNGDVQKNRSHLIDADEGELIVLEWEYAADVLDRVFLIIFVILLLLICIVLMLVGALHTI